MFELLEKALQQREKVRQSKELHLSLLDPITLPLLDTDEPKILLIAFPIILFMIFWFRFESQLRSVRPKFHLKNLPETGILIFSFAVVIGYTIDSMMILIVHVSAQQQNVSTVSNIDHNYITNSTSQSSYYQRISYSNMNLGCQSIVDVDPGSSAYNKTAIKCFDESLKKCEHSNLHLLYGSGSLTISIQGKGENNLCLLKLVHEIEMGQKGYVCSIPLDKLATWTSWNKSGGVDAVKDVLPFCKRTG